MQGWRSAAGAWICVTVMTAACSPAQSDPVPAAPAVSREAPDGLRSAAPTPGTRRIIFLGDSLTAGLGLSSDRAYPALIQSRLDARGSGWTVVNAGVSGDTSAGGVRRLDWSLEGGAAVVVIALGGNDALRGLPVADLKVNLDRLVAQAKASGARVVVAGMEAPPNNGPEYTAAFRAAYREVAARHDVVLLPFLLDGVAGVEALNQADGIHPNDEGARRVADTVWTVLDPIVRDIEAAASR
jgi:acyl-CoA thioesterase I